MEAHRHSAVRDRFNLNLDLLIRECRKEDLKSMEWFGAFTHHRELIARAFERHRRGEVVMLVADLQGFPVGQVWVDFKRGDGPLIYALRVMPFLEGLGIGSRLIAAAEGAAIERALPRISIGVEKHNTRARRLYERLGYLVTRELRETYSYRTISNEEHVIEIDEWLLTRSLVDAG